MSSLLSMKPVIIAISREEVFFAMSLSDSRLSSTNPGFRSRSSGGYPVIASSGNPTMSTPSLSASCTNLRLFFVLPSRSPTLAFIWAKPIRILPSIKKPIFPLKTCGNDNFIILVQEHLLNLYRVFPALSCPYPHHIIHVCHEYLAVSYPPCTRCIYNSLYYLFRHIVCNYHFKLYLRQKIHHIFRPPVQLGVTFLTAESLYFCNCISLYAYLAKGVLYLVQLERLDNGFNFFHSVPPFRSRVTNG